MLLRAGNGMINCGQNYHVNYKYLGHLGIGLLLLHLAEEFGVKDSSKS